MKKIVQYPSDILRKKSEEVKNIKEIKPLINSMKMAHKLIPSYGVAAPQVGANVRAFVYSHKEYTDSKIRTVINPVIKVTEDREEELWGMYEGCLSVPGRQIYIERPSYIVVTGVDERGKEITIEAIDLHAHILLHEIDHLDGKLIIDYNDNNKYNKKVSKG